MAIPNVPTDFLVQPGNGKVFLSWSPAVGAIAGSTGVTVGSTGAYDILRSTDAVNYSLLTSINQTQYYDSPSTGMVLNYQVRANGNSGQSAACAPIATTVVNFGQTTLGAVRLAAQQRADMVNSDFVTKQEWNDYINKSYTELYDILIQTYGDEYYVATPYSIATDGRSSGLYNLPNNIYKLLGVDLGVAGPNTWVSLSKFSFLRRNQYSYYTTAITPLGVLGLRYRLIGNQIEFIPIPSSNLTIRLWFIPRPITLLADYDVLDGISGWDEYVTVDAAIKAMQKEESDVSVLFAQKQALLTRITAAASNRDAGIAEGVTDVQRNDCGGWNNFGGGGPF